MSDPIVIGVDDIAPAKDGALSILNPDHRDYPRAQALCAIMRVTMAGRSPVRLEMGYSHATGKDDGLDMIDGGVRGLWLAYVMC